MEHRWSERKPLNMDVYVYHRGTPVAACKTRDVSRGGMQIRVGPLGFYKNTPLELEFEILRDGELRRYRLPGNVVHCSRNRMGVMLDESHPEVREALHRLLSAAEFSWSSLAGEVYAPEHQPPLQV